MSKAKMVSLSLGAGDVVRHTPTAGWQQHWNTMQILILTEVRLRARRWTSLIAVFLMAAMCWNIISDPASGYAMIVIDRARVLYTSSALALGSSSLLSMIMLFVGFFLVRGRVADDIRTGIGSLIAASPVSNAVFLSSRWIGGVLYFLLLIFAGMLSVIALQMVRGEPGIDFWVYLQTYSLVFIPLAFYVVSLALLFDSVPFLMGKLGDLLFFILWIAQLSLISKVMELGKGESSAWFIFDFCGLVTTVANLQGQLGTKNFSLGGSNFDPALAPIVLSASLWSVKLTVLRVATALFALLPLLLAFPLFHRFSPDRVKQSQSRKRRTPIEILNQWSRPLARFVQPLMSVANRMPNFFGQVVADTALTLISAPVFILCLVVLNGFALFSDDKGLFSVVPFIVMAWGVLIVDISTRDYQAGIESMTAAVSGGVERRYLRQLSACMLLAMMFGGVAILRLLSAEGFVALMLLAGFVAASAMACAAGRITRSARPFLSLFLFWLYVASQAKSIPMVDLFGFNHVATQSTLILMCELAVASLIVGIGYNKWKNS